MSSIGQTITGPRFYEMDEVWLRFYKTLCLRHSIDGHSTVVWQKKSLPGRHGVSTEGSSKSLWRSCEAKSRWLYCVSYLTSWSYWGVLVLELAVTTGEFSTAIGELSGSDLNPHLSRSLSVLAEVEKKSQDLGQSQAQDDALTLMSTVEEYLRIINSIRVSWGILIVWRATEIILLR